MFYIIKMIHLDKEQDPTNRLPRNWSASSDGIFLQKEVALEYIQGNYGDLNEGGYYEYAVVLEIEEGLYPIGKEIQWFAWDRYMDEYVRSVRPSFMDGWALSL